MWGWIAFGALSLASTALPYIFPTPAPEPKPTTSDKLLQISLALGIAISAFTLWQYLKKGRL